MDRAFDEGQTFEHGRRPLVHPLGELGGVTALLAMLASCAAGITVVGIDNGFGAACAIARMMP